MFDKTELLSTVLVLKIILLKPTLTLLHCEFHVWKFIITLERCNGNFSSVIHDEWFLNVTLSQKFKFSFKTNKHTNQGNLLNKWASVLLKQPLPICLVFPFQYVPQ